MNFLRRFVLLLCLLVMSTAVRGAAISERQARDMAVQFVSSHSFRSTAVKIAHKAPMLGEDVVSGKPAYYVFNIDQADAGYIIVAGDDRVPAILGYSDHGSFDEADVPPVMREWLEGYALQIQAISAGAQVETDRSSVGEAIAPMLNVNWGQGMPYNVLLPHVPSSDNAHAYVGCVAVAMAQVMSYWQYPPRPTKTIPGYTSNAGKTYAVTMPSLAPMDFDWDNMQNTYYTNDSTSTECMAVANLMKYSTTAMQSNFGLTSTGSYTRNIPAKLIEYFGYKNSARYVYREDFSTEGWERLIYNELAEGRPVAYGGNKQSAGHAYVCDGYDGEGMFHINWGWAGKSNGYFLLNLLNPSAEGIGSAAGAYGYVKGQGIAIGLMPDDGTDGEAAFSFDELVINSTNAARSGASSNFSVTVSGKFVNNTNVTSQFRQGWGLYKDGELQEVLFIRYTTSPISNGEYVSVDGRSLSFGSGITSGTYRIKPIYSIYPSEDYKPCIGSDVNYIEVTFGGNYSCTIKGYGTAGSTTKYIVNSCTTEGTLNHGKPVTVTLNLKNAGTSSNDLIYMFVDGEFKAMGLANIAAGESGDLVYRFTPATAGRKTLTFSLNEDGTSPFYTRNVPINTMPEATLDVSYRILNITDYNNRVITADHYTIIADITNTGTETYDEDFSVRLYRINNSETNVGTELQNQTQPLLLSAGESTSLQFDFDHDLIDGWRYFCYLYYYSNGSTVSSGTRWYTLNFPTGPVETHQVTAVVNPANGAEVNFTGGVTEGEAQVGKTVKFTVEPSEGYIISSVQAIDADGEPVNLNYNAGNGLYSFVMPASGVTITVTALTSYNITVSPNIPTGGCAVLSTDVAVTGETVTVTATPNVGWIFSGLNVYSNGSFIHVNSSGNGVYTFEMPDADATVNVIFERGVGYLFKQVNTRSDITEGDIYVIASKYYDKAIKYYQQGEETFGSTGIVDWLDEDKSIMRVDDETCLIQMRAVNPDTIRHGATSGARTNAFLSYGNGYLTTSNGNLIVSQSCTDLCRAGMFISSNESNFLARFFNEATGASSDYMTVRYDYAGDKFRIINYSSDNQQRVWLYKLVESYLVNTECTPEDAATITLMGYTVENMVQAGETVFFTVEPQGDYTIGEVIVTDINGNTIIPETDEEGTYYSFTMPDAEVTISVTMEESQGPELLRGDVNGDGDVTIADVALLIDYLLGVPCDIDFDAADVNQNQSITIADVTALIDILLGAN